jgi:hypothetical protein
MGFTPWPYEATTAAVDDLYGRVLANGEFIAHHIDGGIPWPEAFAGTAYNANVEAELADRLARTPAGTPVYLAITPISSPRDGLAEYWGASKGLARPGPWAAKGFDDPDVIQAFVSYALDLIDRFDPAWFNYAIETTELALNGTQADLDGLVAFASQVYPQLKAAHPDLPIFVSGGFRSPGSSEAGAIEAAYTRLLPYTDRIGVSLYPFVFFEHAGKGDPDALPVGWLQQAQDLDPAKRLIIAETAWIAEPLVIPQFGVDVPATAADQAAYLERLFDEVERLDAELVTWWAPVDFDTLWSQTLGSDPIAKIWRDTGLWDENLQPRQGLSVWQARRAEPWTGG